MARPEAPTVGQSTIERYLYIPGESRREAYGVDRLGKKAFENDRLRLLGLPVPEFVNLTTDAWKDWKADYKRTWLDKNTMEDVDPTPQLSFDVWGALLTGITSLEYRTGQTLGNPTHPLFVSVRSGAPESLPGAMHTILNVGLNFDTVGPLGEIIGERESWYSFFTLIRKLGTHAFNIPETEFTTLRDTIVGHHPTTPKDVSYYQELVRQSLAVFTKNGRTQEFPLHPKEQLRWATDSVLRSWESDEAIVMRRKRKIWDSIGTAVTIQEMVWGNSIKEDAGSGVFFTHNPENYGPPICAFAAHGQGTKVVSDTAGQQDTSLRQIPQRFRSELRDIMRVLEKEYTRPVEGEFTIDGEKLKLLQVREVGLSSLAHFRFIHKQLVSGKLSEAEAKLLVSTAQLRRIIAPGLDPIALEKAQKNDCIGQGVSLSPGCSMGQVVRSIAEAKAESNKKVILTGTVSKIDLETLPENVIGIVSSKGSVGSHLARIATGQDDRGVVVIYGVSVPRMRKNAVITLNGDTGEVFRGRIKTSKKSGPLSSEERRLVMKWQKERRDNPWLFVTKKNNVQPIFDNALTQLRVAKENITSPKGRVIQVVNALLPPETRMEYTVFSMETPVRDILTRGDEILRSGSDLSIRSCPTPDIAGRGKSPYAYVTTPEELRRFCYGFFFTKQGGLPKWRGQRNPRLTEIVLGKIPKGKLDKNFEREHCAWTLSCTHDSIVLQIVPFTPLLRSHEEVDKADIISLVIHYDPTKGHSEDGRVDTGMHVDRVVVGTNLEKDNNTKKQAYHFLSYVSQTIFGRWWSQYNIPGLMAGLTEAFPRTSYYPLALEGQARITPDGESGKEVFCLTYGCKADPTKKNGGR